MIRQDQNVELIALQRAVGALLGATCIEMYGIGSSVPIALDAYYRFLRIGLPVTFNTLPVHTWFNHWRRGVRYISYVRVSTAKQGQSGLGLDAQRTSIANFIASNPGAELIEEIQETESGSDNQRPKLDAAIKRCKKTGAILLVAKLDRLSRRVSFIAGLLEGGAPFVVAEMPNADETMLGMLSVFAQHERKEISRRTKAGLAEARKRRELIGERLGNPTPERSLAEGRARMKAKREEFCRHTLPVIEGMRNRGMSFREIVDELNRTKVPTFRGSGVWGISAVQAVLAHGSKDQVE